MKPKPGSQSCVERLIDLSIRPTRLVRLQPRPCSFKCSNALGSFPAVPKQGRIIQIFEQWPAFKMERAAFADRDDRARNAPQIVKDICLRKERETEGVQSASADLFAAR